MKEGTNNDKKRYFNLRNEISEGAFDNIAEFYNKNENSFLKFENIFGINLWFLNHSRTYFSYRNFLFKEVFKKNDLVFSKEARLNLITVISRVAYEFLLILIKYKRPKTNTTEYLIISNSTDMLDKRNKRFGNLDYDMLYNRNILDIKKKKSSKDFDHRKMTNTDSIFLAYIFRFSFIVDLLKFNSHLNLLLKEISKDNNLLKNLEHRHISHFFSKNRFFFYIIYLRFKSLNLYFRKLNIKGILLSDENSPQQKVMQYAAYRNNIQVFGFQHGNIHPLHPAYIYGKYKTKPILPTITFTWGSYFTDLLRNQGGYPANKVKTVGRIPPINTKRKLNPLINEKDNIILYASQPQRDSNIRYKLLADILDTVNVLSPRYKLVIRPHPAEEDNDFFNKVAKDVGFRDFIIDRESDLNTHFKICNIFLVAFSTVGTEFISYFKPLLVLDYLEQDLMKWIDKGIGVPIRNKKDLLDKLSKSQIKINREKYISFINKYYISNSNVLEKINNTMKNLH